MGNHIFSIKKITSFDLTNYDKAYKHVLIFYYMALNFGENQKSQIYDASFIFKNESKPNIFLWVLTNDKNTKLTNSDGEALLNPFSKKRNIYENPLVDAPILKTNSNITYLQHGASSNVLTFHKIIEPFFKQSSKEVLILGNLPDHKNSGKITSKKYNMRDYSEPLYSALTRLGIKKSLFATSSWGASPIATMAEDHPNFFEGFLSSEPNLYLKDFPKAKLINTIFYPLKPICALLGWDKYTLSKIGKKIQISSATKKGSFQEANIYKKRGEYLFENGAAWNLIYATKKRDELNLSSEIPIGILLGDKGMAMQQKNASFSQTVTKLSEYFKNHTNLKIYPITAGHHPHREDASVLEFVSILKDFREITQNKKSYNPLVIQNTMSQPTKKETHITF